MKTPHALLDRAEHRLAYARQNASRLRRGLRYVRGEPVHGPITDDISLINVTQSPKRILRAVTQAFLLLWGYRPHHAYRYSAFGRSTNESVQIHALDVAPASVRRLLLDFAAEMDRYVLRLPDEHSDVGTWRRHIEGLLALSKQLFDRLDADVQQQRERLRQPVVRYEAGQFVRHAHLGTCLVLGEAPLIGTQDAPMLALRSPDVRLLEAVQPVLAPLTPSDDPPVDLTGPRTARRRFFDLHYWVRSGRRTCPCCGYPTLPDQIVYFRTDPASVRPDPVLRCFLCGWYDDGQDDPYAEAVSPVSQNRGYRLAAARRHAIRYGVMLAPDDEGYARLQAGAAPHLRTQIRDRLDAIRLEAMNGAEADAVYRDIEALRQQLQTA